MAKYEVELSPTGCYISIKRNGVEILFWDQLEWEEDAGLVYSIANVIRMTATPDQLDAQLQSIGKL